MQQALLTKGSSKLPLVMAVDRVGHGENGSRKYRFFKMDGLRASAYLSRVILRRLLTCLALITGLAAIGAPVNAGVVDTFAAQVRTSKAAPAAPDAERAECPVQCATVVGRREQASNCRQRRTVVITIPTVQYGPDRALE
jgi:hypothetical protein